MASPPGITVQAFGKTDVGLIREHNEDNFLIVNVSADERTNDPREPLDFNLGERGALFLVCDGMGGAAAGEVASQMAVESISASVGAAKPGERATFSRRLRRAIEEANDKIYAQSRDNQSERGMGTTCTAVGLVDGTLVVGQIGDSRCYVKRGDRLTQVTKDQSLAWQLMEAGAMTAEEAKGFEHANIILQALGVQERVEVVLSQVDLRKGDTVLVSSDGLHGPVSDEDMLQILNEESDLKRAADRLIARALEKEGPDNVTVVLARFDGPDLPERKAEDLVQFVPYDPGYDPEEVRRPPIQGGEKVTVEVTVPKEVIRATAPTTEVSTNPGAALAAEDEDARPGEDRPAESRSLLTFVFLTLVAAAAAGAFVKCDRSRALERESQAAAAKAATQPASQVPPATPAMPAAAPAGATVPAEPAVTPPSPKAP
jgi:protein phosphatase